jgi:hypothetical protein
MKAANILTMIACVSLLSCHRSIGRLDYLGSSTGAQQRAIVTNRTTTVDAKGTSPFVVRTIELGVGDEKARLIGIKSSGPFRFCDQVVGAFTSAS